MKNCLLITRDTPFNSRIPGHIARVMGWVDYSTECDVSVDICYPKRFFGASKKALGHCIPVWSLWHLFDYDNLITAPFICRLCLGAFKILRRMVAVQVDIDEKALVPLYKKLKCLSVKKKYDYIVISVPPHSFLKLGSAIKQIFPDTCLIADCRDPWTLRGDLYSSTPRAMLDEKTQLSVFDHVLVVSEVMRERYITELGIRNVEVLQNGFHDSMFAGANKRKGVSNKNKNPLIFGYFGTGGIGSGARSGKDLAFLCEFFSSGLGAHAERGEFNEAKLRIYGEIHNKKKTKFRSVSFPGKVTGKRFTDALEVVDVGIFVYTNELDVDLVMGTKLYDYLAKDKFIWVITKGYPRSIASFSEIVGGIVITDLNQSDLESGMEEVCRNWRLFGGREKQLINRFSRRNLIYSFWKGLEKSSEQIQVG